MCYVYNVCYICVMYLWVVCNCSVHAFRVWGMRHARAILLTCGVVCVLCECGEAGLIFMRHDCGVCLWCQV